MSQTASQNGVQDGAQDSAHGGIPRSTQDSAQDGARVSAHGGLSGLFAHFTPHEIGILQARARALAKAVQDTTPVYRRAVLTIQLGNEQYALFLDDLVAIYDEISITPVPCTPAHIKGIASVRGRLVTVLDLAAILTGTPGNYAGGCKLLVLETHQEQVALLVNQTDTVSSEAVDQIQPLPPELDHMRHALGILSSNVLLLDMRALVNDPALVVTSITASTTSQP